MDDALWVNDNVNVVIVNAKQVMRLDDLQTLVHEGGRVHSDLAAHAPVGVLQSICHFHSLQFFYRPVPKSAS